MYYNINLVTGEVCKSKLKNSLINDPYFSFGSNNSVIVSDAERMFNDANITCAAMVRVYNQYNKESVKRFADRKTAVKRTMIVMEKSKYIEEAPNNNSGSANILHEDKVKGNYEQLVATNNGNKEKSMKINKQDKIILVELKNPRREGTCGWNSYNIIVHHNTVREGEDLTVEKYLELGGRMNDLKWDLQRERLQLQSGGA